jgi:hypothetical protein
MTTTYSNLSLALADSGAILCLAKSGTLNDGGGLNVAGTDWKYPPATLIGKVFVISADVVVKKVLAKTTNTHVEERWKLVRADQGLKGNADFEVPS